MAAQNITAFVPARKVRASAFHTPSVTNSSDKFHAAQSTQAPTPLGVSVPTGAPKKSARLLRADMAQVLSGDTLFEDGVPKESAPVLPAMSPTERDDLSLLAQRTFYSDLDAYRFWHELVETAAFFQMMEKR